MRKFEEWLKTFRPAISTYDYYIDFKKIYQNVDSIKIELNILNSLIGSVNIEDDFISLSEKYPEVIKCIPILLAVRAKEIYAMDSDGSFLYHFDNLQNSIEQYKYLCEKQVYLTFCRIILSRILLIMSPELKQVSIQTAEKIVEVI